MKLIDLSQPLYDDCPNCPSHPAVRSEIVADHATDGWRLEKLTLVNHTGSHLDAPLHKLANAPSLDDIPLESFVGAALVLDLRASQPDQPLGPQQLADAIQRIRNTSLNGIPIPADLKDTIL